MKDLFIDNAVSIGLTEDEAEDAYYEMGMDRMSNSYCQQCGVELVDSVNCQDEYIDDYCNNCSNKYEINLKKLDAI